MNKAKKLWEQRFSARVIMAELGIESYWDVYYICREDRRKMQIEKTLSWQKMNPEKARETARRAQVKYRKKLKDHPHRDTNEKSND